MAKKNAANRAGPWSRDEKDFIANNADKMEYGEIARRLQRNPDRVKEYIKNVLGKKSVANQDFVLNPEYDLQSSPVWHQLKQQFSQEELKLFLYHWARTISQFKDDVFPTEELQIMDSIKIEILMDRTLRQQRESQAQIEHLEAEILKLKHQDDQDPDNLRDIDRMERLILSHKTSAESLGAEYQNLLAKKISILKELKATRAERIKNIESSKQTVIGWISELIRNRALRKELGLHMEKMRLAIDLEQIRLMEPHQYIDGTTDTPVLNHETIRKLKQHDKDIEKEKENAENSTDNGN